LKTFTLASPDLAPEAKRALRFPRDEANFLTAPLALQYDAFADRLAAGKPAAAPNCPSTAEGIRTMSFLDAVLRNAHPENTEKWTRLA